MQLLGPSRVPVNQTKRGCIRAQPPPLKNTRRTKKHADLEATKRSGAVSAPATLPAKHKTEKKKPNNQKQPPADQLPPLTDLGGNLGATHDGGEGALGLLDGALKVVELLLQQEAGHGGRQELGHALGRAVCAVSGAEGVVHEQVERRGELLGEVCDYVSKYSITVSIVRHHIRVKCKPSTVLYHILSYNSVQYY